METIEIQLDPKIAAQVEAYQCKQPIDFKRGRRTDEQMSAMVKVLIMNDIPHLAAYVEHQQGQVSPSNKSNHETGKNIFRNGINTNEITRCVGCHGTNGLGLLSNTPHWQLTFRRFKIYIIILKGIKTHNTLALDAGGT